MSIIELVQKHNFIVRSMIIVTVLAIVSCAIAIAVQQTKLGTALVNKEAVDFVLIGKEGFLTKDALIFDSPESEDLMRFAMSLNDKGALDKLESEGRIFHAEAKTKVLVLAVKPGDSSGLTQVRMLGGSLANNQFWVLNKDLRRQ